MVALISENILGLVSSYTIKSHTVETVNSSIHLSLLINRSFITIMVEIGVHWRNRWCSRYVNRLEISWTFSSIFTWNLVPSEWYLMSAPKTVSGYWLERFWLLNFNCKIATSSPSGILLTLSPGWWQHVCRDLGFFSGYGTVGVISSVPSEICFQ